MAAPQGGGLIRKGVRMNPQRRWIRLSGGVGGGADSGTISRADGPPCRARVAAGVVRSAGPSGALRVPAGVGTVALGEPLPSVALDRPPPTRRSDPPSGVGMNAATFATFEGKRSAPPGQPPRPGFLTVLFRNECDPLRDASHLGRRRSGEGALPPSCSLEPASTAPDRRFRPSRVPGGDPRFSS